MYDRTRDLRTAGLLGYVVWCIGCKIKSKSGALQSKTKVKGPGGNRRFVLEILKSYLVFDVFVVFSGSSDQATWKVIRESH